jgi:ribonuclease-3
VVAEMLYLSHPGWDEGRMTTARATLVCKTALARFARDLGFGRWVVIDRQLELSGARNSDRILADVFEAWVGALFRDKGMHGTTRWLNKFLKKHAADKL